LVLVNEEVALAVLGVGQPGLGNVGIDRRASELDELSRYRRVEDRLDRGGRRFSGDGSPHIGEFLSDRQAGKTLRE
jgi:hypothetical protein